MIVIRAREQLLVYNRSYGVSVENKDIMLKKTAEQGHLQRWFYSGTVSYPGNLTGDSEYF